MCELSYATLGRHIRSARAQLKLRQEDVANLAGVSLSYYGRLERGKVRPTVERLGRVCHALKIPLSVALLGVDEPLDIEKVSGTPTDAEFIEYFTRIKDRVSDKAKIVMMRICHQIEWLDE